MPILNSLRDFFSVGNDFKINLADMTNTSPTVSYTPTMPKKKQGPKQIGYGYTPIDRPGWEKPVFDLLEIAKAAQVESYIRLSIDKHREHILRHGWSFVGKNPKTVAYIYKRMHELSESMGKPVDGEIYQAITNLVKYHNPFLMKTRNRDNEFKSRFGIKRGKLTGLFSLNPVSMRYRRSSRNQILEWYQLLDDGSTGEQLKPEDIVHIPFSKEDGYILGVPYLLQVLDDIQYLRRMEEITGKLVHKFAFPLYHHKLGDKDNPPGTFDDGGSDIGEAYAAVAGMAPEGHLVTSYTHVIEVVGAGTTAIDMLPYLQYAKERVVAGLNLSSVDLGEGDTSNRSTAETLSKGLADRCAEYQKVFATMFTFYILDELLLEAEYELTPENRVHMFFPAIDREAKRAEQNHLADLFVKGLITHAEFRIESGREPFTAEQWKDTQFEHYTKPELELKASIKEVAADKSIANKNRPSNQHGTKATKTRVTKDSIEAFLSDNVDSITPVIEKQMNAGITAYNQDHSADLYLGPGILKAFTEDCMPEFLSKIKGSPALREFYIDSALFAAYNYAYMRAGQIHNKHTHVSWALSDSACEVCSALEPMKIRRFTAGQVLPIHDKCVCGIKFESITN